VHPLLGQLRMQGQSVRGFADEIGYSAWHTGQVLLGRRPASPAFRAAALLVTGGAEADLFLAGCAGDGPAVEGGHR
jgi:hypothetical protein